MSRRRVLLVCPGNLDGREAELVGGLAAENDLMVAVRTPATVVRVPPNVRVVGLDALGRIPTARHPDFVVYASAPPLRLHWRVWRWKRFRCPRALLGGFWPAVRSTWLTRLAIGSLDFLFADAETSRPVGFPANRVLVTRDGAGAAAEILAFLIGRRTAEDHSVLWVDEDLSLHSPSTKHLVYSIPHLQAAGWEVRGWCLTADAAARDRTEIREFPPAPRGLRLFTPYWFFALVNLYGVVQTVLKGRPPARLVHTLGGAFLGADLVSVQFVNHLWLRKQIELVPRNLKDLALVLLTALGAAKDQLQFSNPRCRMFLPASDSIGDEVRRRCLPRAEIETLANSYDETRFNPSVRQKWRASMRLELGLTEADTVFSFASQGHYKRKGFWLAVEALAQLRPRADLPQARGIKFLVIGGQPGTLERLQGELDGLYPDWKVWIIFVGSQPAVERYFSAADAFLFPSYFEAFCLAEIEAGALGLPLLLTPHHGTEMILRDGVNGLRLGFDPAELARTLAVFLDQGLPPFPASPGRGLDRAAYARALADVYDRMLKSTPTPPC